MALLMKIRVQCLTGKFTSWLSIFWCGSQDSCKSDDFIGPRELQVTEGWGHGDGRVSTDLTKASMMEAASKLRENLERSIARPCRLSQNCGASCSFVPQKATVMEEGERQSARAGLGAAPRPQVVIIQDSKDHSHNPDTALPSEGPIPYKHLQCAQITRWGGVWEIHVYTCACVRVYISTCICFV